MDLSKIPMGSIKGRPVVLFPEGWAQGWAHPDIEDGTIPLTVAEAYMAGAVRSSGQRHTFPFGRLADMNTPKLWRYWRDTYYAGMAPCPFGYGHGSPLAPWGMSKRGIPKLHPDDE